MGQPYPITTCRLLIFYLLYSASLCYDCFSQSRQHVCIEVTVLKLALSSRFLSEHTQGNREHTCWSEGLLWFF